jgi:hypothetical protein
MPQNTYSASTRESNHAPKARSSNKYQGKQTVLLITCRALTTNWNWTAANGIASWEYYNPVRKFMLFKMQAGQSVAATTLLRKKWMVPMQASDRSDGTPNDPPAEAEESP